MPIRKKKAEPVVAPTPEPEPVVEEVSLIDHLLSLREAIDAEADLHPDRVKVNLANIASAIHSLQDALWTEAALERPDA